MQGTSVIRKKVAPQVNLVIPPVVNRLISVGELRAVAIKHLVELSVEHDFFSKTFFLREKLVMIRPLSSALAVIDSPSNQTGLSDPKENKIINRFTNIFGIFLRD